MARPGALSGAVRITSGAEQARDAAALAEALADHGPGAAVLAFPDGHQVPVPRNLADAIRALAGELAAGRSVTMLPADAVLTPAEAAELLGLSRPFVVRLLDEGTIPSDRLPGSRHRRVLLADVVAFAERRERRRAGRQKIASAIADADLPY